MENKKLDLFCKVFNELISDLVSLYPEDSSLSLFSASVKATQMLLGNELFSYQVIDYLEPYYKQILDKDENFFLQNSLIEEDCDDSFIENEIKRIKKIWNEPETTNNTKECIWKYFINLVKIAKLIKK